MADAPNNQTAHVDDYMRFTGIMKWGTLAAAIAAAFVVFLIA